MRVVMFAVSVAAVLLLTRGTPPGAVLAQDVEKKAPVIEIGEGKDGKFRFYVLDEEGKLLATSGPSGFGSATDAGQSIEHLRAVMKTAKVTLLKKKSKSKAVPPS